MALTCILSFSKQNIFFVVLLCSLCIARVVGQMVIDPTPFKVGIVRDLQLRYSRGDQDIYEGVLWWQQWIMAQGGLKYGNITRPNITIVERDTANLDSTQVSNLVRAAYTDMIVNDNVDITATPFTTARTSAANNASVTYGRLSLGVSGIVSLFKNGSSYFSGISPSNQNPLFCARAIVATGAKTYSVFSSSDSISIASIPVATAYMNQSGMNMSSFFQFAITSTDTTYVTSLLTQYLQNFTQNNDMGDVIAAFVSADYYTTIISVLNSLKPNIKLAAFFTPTDVFTDDELHAIDASGWLLGIPFVNTTNFGISGINGGTSSQFQNDFVRQFGHPPGYDAVVMAANLLAYTQAVQYAGSINATLVKKAMVSMPVFDTFYGKMKFASNGTNVLAKYDTVQYIRNQPVVLDANHSLIYPAPFPWLQKESPIIIHESGRAKTGMIVGVAVGASVVVIAALIYGFFMIKKQRAATVEALNKMEEGERRAYKLDMKQVEIVRLIGSGSFGYVYKGNYRGADVAIKKLKKQNLTKKQLDEFTQEASTMVGLRHPINSTPPDLCIITELMPRGSLYDVLHEKFDIPVPFRVKMALDVLRGLQFIHSAGFIHRDLKSPNLLIDKSWNIKIADFGLSCGKSNSEDEAQISLLWTAPEILTKEKGCYSELSDVYSFGVIMWELMSRKTPFESLPPGTIATRVVQGLRPEIDSSWDKTIQQVIKFTWDGDKEQRVDVKTARRMLEEIEIGDPESPNIRPVQPNQFTGSGSSHPPSTAGITFVTVEFVNASIVWTLKPEKAVAAMNKFQETLNEYCTTFAGYITQTVETRYTVAFSNVVSALNFCLRMQKGLSVIDLNETSTRTPVNAMDLEEFVTNDGSEQQAPDQNSPLVSMGVHATVPMVSRDSETNTVKYTGPGVNIPDTLCSMAHGGQILFGADVYTMAMQSLNALDAFLVESLGYKKEGDLPDYFVVYQMVPESFSSGRLEYFRTNTTPAKKLQSFLVNYTDLAVESVIGSGSFGSVYSSRYRGQQVIFKQFMKQKYVEAVAIQMRSEASLLSKMEHENVVKFYGLVPTVPNIGYVAEYCAKGGLNHLLYDQAKDLPWARRLEFAIDAAKGMAFLHSNAIVHGDLKSANLLVSENFKVKVADAGFSKIKLDNQTMTQISAVSWTAPEVTKDTFYSEKSDVYSYGIILWEIVFRTRPWEGMHTMKLIVTVECGGRPPVQNWPATIPQTLLPIIQGCWDGEPERRPRFREVIGQLEALRR